MVDTAGQTSRMTKRNTSDIQHEITNCPEDDATRRKKNGGQKKSTGRVGDSRYVDTAKMKASVTAFVSGGIYHMVAWVGRHLRWRPPGPLRTT